LAVSLFSSVIPSFSSCHSTLFFLCPPPNSYWASPSFSSCDIPLFTSFTS
jgi:hypothetical protein